MKMESMNSPRGHRTLREEEARLHLSSRPRREGLLAGVAVLLAACLSMWTLYMRSTAALRGEVQDNLLRTARAAAALVDGDLHATFVSQAQESSPEYEAAIAPLSRILVANDQIKFVYTFVLRDGEVHFVLDPTPSGDADGDGIEDKSHIMDPYPEATPAMLKTLSTRTPVAETKVATDRWGSFISAFAPFYDARGQFVGAAGVDLTADRYMARLARVRRAAALGLAVALATACLVGAGVFAFRRAAARAESRIHKMKEDLAAQAVAEATANAKSQFLANMNHELRTPMNGVLGMTELLKETSLTEEQLDFTETIRRSGQLMLVLVNDILDFWDLESGQVAFESAPFDLLAVIEEVGEIMVDRVREKGLELMIDFAPGTPRWIVGDRRRVRQILANLANNAVKFTERGSVRIVAECLERGGDEALLRISVVDTGIGIPAEKQACIFDKFTQADSSSTRRYGGTGLGLSIASRLVELMGGSIGVTSQPGEGSTFRFTLRTRWSGEGWIGAGGADLDAAGAVPPSFTASRSACSPTPSASP